MPSLLELAESKKRRIEKKYKVNIEIVDELVECHTPQRLVDAYKQDRYCICLGNLNESVRLTEILIQFKLAVNTSLIQPAAEGLIIKANKKAMELGKIVKKARGYIESNANKRATFREIAAKLTQEHVLTPNGKETWHAQSVRSIERRYEKLTTASRQSA